MASLRFLRGVQSPQVGSTTTPASLPPVFEAQYHSQEQLSSSACRYWRLFDVSTGGKRTDLTKAATFRRWFRRLRNRRRSLQFWKRAVNKPASIILRAAGGEDGNGDSGDSDGNGDNNDESDDQNDADEDEGESDVAVKRVDKSGKGGKKKWLFIILWSAYYKIISPGTTRVKF